MKRVPGFCEKCKAKNSLVETKYPARTVINLEDTITIETVNQIFCEKCNAIIEDKRERYEFPKKYLR